MAAPNAAENIKAITAVEPSSGMRDAFNKYEGLQPSPERPEIKIIDGSFGEIPVADASIDVIVGESACTNIECTVLYCIT